MPAYTATDLTCLSTVIKNTSGSAKYFSFLPTHGLRLAADEEVSIVGDLFEACTRGCRAVKRNISALLKAIDDGDLTIVSTPAPVFYDAGWGESRVARVKNGTLGTDGPCWDSVSV